MIPLTNIWERRCGFVSTDSESELDEVDTTTDNSIWSDTDADQRPLSPAKRPLTRRRKRHRPRFGKATYSPARGWRHVIRVAPLTGPLRARPPWAAVRPWDVDRLERGPMPPTTPPPPHLLPIGAIISRP